MNHLSFIRDLIQATVLGLIWWSSTGPSQEWSKSPEFIALGREMFGEFGVWWVRSLWWSVPPSICGFVMHLFKRVEYVIWQRQQQVGR